MLKRLIKYVCIIIDRIVIIHQCISVNESPCSFGHESRKIVARKFPHSCLPIKWNYICADHQIQILMICSLTQMLDIWKAVINSSTPGQNSHHFTDNIFKCIFVIKKNCISIGISLKFVAKGPIGNKAALFKAMAQRRAVDKPFHESMISLTHIGIYWGRWVECIFLNKSNQIWIWISAKDQSTSWLVEAVSHLFCAKVWPNPMMLGFRDAYICHQVVYGWSKMSLVSFFDAILIFSFPFLGVFFIKDIDG